MEEHIGMLWHRWVTRAARHHTLEATVTLAEIEKTAGLLFRAFGGDPGLRVAPAAAIRHGARRGWLARVAGVGERADLACRDRETLQLPAQLALLPSRELNRDLYLWLIALAAAHDEVDSTAPWWEQNQQATGITLTRYPGLRLRYQRLVDAVLTLRIPPEQLPPDEAHQENRLRQALREPSRVAEWLPARRPLQPVPLWLYPASNHAAVKPNRQDDSGSPGAGSHSPRERDRSRRRAEYTDLPERQSPFLLPFRAESLLSWAEFVRANRPDDDDPEPNATRAAEDMDMLSITQDGSSIASRVRFDLDLPSASEDDLPLGPGIKLPEWNYRKQTLLPDYCCLQEMLARRAVPCELPLALRRDTQRLRRQFEILRPARGWRCAQPDGEEPDIDACVRHVADCANDGSSYQHGLYRQSARQERDLACLLLADFSMSTDAWVSNHGRVIEVIRDSLFLFAEALAATGDQFALYGFSSRKRQHVRVQRIKSFSERYTAVTRGRINAIKPGYYTRMGAAVRYATMVLGRQTAARRLLLLLTDGKPNDLDHYEGRYGIEDTRMALLEACRQSLQPFCVTIDQEANDYLPYLFGRGGFILIRHPEDLPRQLLLLYTRLTH
ncbi:MAG TPA: VWA domain-containing protein [Candidatus Competibacteraceae bacterium]|nr:VWA domain-containing protein [Candidatus Competibacteraceae bacterium]MCP5459868.1 VWA domain-containing protein [Gammaproteobacteria bacterium]HPF58596.1 VWA domain-containing protein [Candidatus Competibacteraceae bacterium]HRY18066.1 VWA domain-containing protein [Candidatus Competibacteraceae bacterium]